jgi:hypothetical protein
LTRIFLTLAWLAVVTIVAAFVIGISIEDLHTDHSEAMRRWATVHRLTGIAAALAVVLVNSIVVTYFIGTSRWCKEVSETYGLGKPFIERSTRLKRRTFPWTVMGMLAIIGVASLGAAADPATLWPNTEAWITPHLIGSMCGFALIVWSFFVEWQNIQANQEVINDVLAEVRRIRAERGLAV